MNKINIIIIPLIFLTVKLSAQGMSFHPQEHMKKIEELEKIKLIETLDLSEDEFVKFFARRKEYKEKEKKSFFLRDSLSRLLQENVKAGNDEEENLKIVKEILSLEKSSAESKEKFILGLSDIIPKTEIVKYVAFEYEFRRQIRERVFRGRRGGNKWRK